MEGAQLSQPDVRPSAYATFTLRARALVTDLAVVGAALAALIVIDTVTDEMPGFGRAFVILIYALVFLYEPVQVAAFGATIGHRRVRIKVVSDSTGGHPSFLIAFARFLVKSLLGLPSFVVMLFTRRRQAFHDLITRTTVQLRDLDESAECDELVVAEQGGVVEAAMPSVGRRILVSSAYLLIGFLLVGSVERDAQSSLPRQ